MTVQVGPTDPEIPQDCIPNVAVRVIQFIRPDGSLSFATRVSSDAPLSQVLGCLVMAAIDIYGASDRPPNTDTP